MIFFCTSLRLSFMVMPGKRSRKSLLMRYSVTIKYSRRFHDIIAKKRPSTLLSLSLARSPIIKSFRLNPSSFTIWQNSLRWPHFVWSAVSRTLWVLNAPGFFCLSQASNSSLVGEWLRSTNNSDGSSAFGISKQGSSGNSSHLSPKWVQWICDTLHRTDRSHQGARV